MSFPLTDQEILDQLTATGLADSFQSASEAERLAAIRNAEALWRPLPWRSVTRNPFRTQGAADDLTGALLMHGRYLWFNNGAEDSLVMFPNDIRNLLRPYLLRARQASPLSLSPQAAAAGESIPLATLTPAIGHSHHLWGTFGLISTDDRVPFRAVTESTRVTLAVPDPFPIGGFGAIRGAHNYLTGPMVTPQDVAGVRWVWKRDGTAIADYSVPYAGHAMRVYLAASPTYNTGSSMRSLISADDNGQLLDVYLGGDNRAVPSSVGTITIEVYVVRRIV